MALKSMACNRFSRESAGLRRHGKTPLAGLLEAGLGQRGQAAVTDAIYFLIVVSFLSVFMFGFSNSYGNNVKEKIYNEYSTSFATSAMKTILYSSTPRDPKKSIYDSAGKDDEIDYLLAMVKEDYSP